MAANTAPRTAIPVPIARNLAITALTPLVWGSIFAVTTELLPPGRPLFTALMRALPAGLLLLAFTRVLPRGIWIGRAAVLGVLNIGAFFPLLFVAAYRLPGGVAAVVGAVGPLLAIAFSAVLLAQRPTMLKLLGGIAGPLGVGMVVLRANAHLDTTGVVAALAGTASMVAGMVLTERWGRPEGVGALTLTAWQLTAGGLLLVPIALVIEGPPPALTGENILGYAYLGIIATAVAYWIWFRGISRLSATSVTFVSLITPVSAAVIGWAALSETLTPIQLLGMAIALGGTLLGQNQAEPQAPRVRRRESRRGRSAAAHRPPAESAGAAPHRR